MHQKAFNGAFEVSSAVLQVRPFLKKETLPRVGDRKYEAFIRRRIENSLLHLSQFQIEDPAQFIFAQLLIDNHFVDSVHEFGREFAARCL